MVTLERAKPLCVHLCLQSRVTASLIKSVCNHSYRLDRIGGHLKCQLIRTTKPIIEPVYLEIEPEIIWVYPNFESSNNVYSNTDWNIN